MNKVCANCGEKIINSKYKCALHCNKCRELLRNSGLNKHNNPYIKNTKQKKERLGTTNFSGKMCRRSNNEPKFDSEQFLVRRQKDYILNKKGKKYGYTITEGDIIRGDVPKDV